MIRVPDFRGIVAILAALAVVVEQLWPGTQWAVVATAAAGALVVHAGQPPASPPGAPSAPAAGA